MRFLIHCAYLLSLVFLSHQSFGNTYKVDLSKSLFAVITHKGGVAKALAHNHFIVAVDPKVNLSIAGDDFTKGSFDFSLNPNSLSVDDPSLQKKWAKAVEDVGVSAEFTEIPDDDRADIRENMLSEGQLHANKFPNIYAKVISIKQLQGAIGKIKTNYVARLQLTIRGKAVESDVPCFLKKTENGIAVTALGKFQFTQFGIEPYSALFGAIANQDPFELFVSLKASQ